MADEEKGKTAVEWFFERLPIRMKNYMAEDYRTAKEMERKQVVEAHYEGQCDNNEGYPIDISEQYFEMTYGKETDRN